MPVINWVLYWQGQGDSPAPTRFLWDWFKYEFAEVRPGVVRAISCRHVIGSKSPVLSQSFLSRCVESNRKQSGKHIVQMEPEYWEAFLPVCSGNKEWGPGCWNCYGWSPFLCVKESGENVAGDMEHIPLCLNTPISHRGKYLWLGEMWLLGFFLPSRRVYIQRDELGDQPCSHTRNFFPSYLKKKKKKLARQPLFSLFPVQLCLTKTEQLPSLSLLPHNIYCHKEIGYSITKGSFIVNDKNTWKCSTRSMGFLGSYYFLKKILFFAKSPWFNSELWGR